MKQPKLSVLLSLDSCNERSPVYTIQPFQMNKSDCLINVKSFIFVFDGSDLSPQSSQVTTAVSHADGIQHHTFTLSLFQSMPVQLYE